eukprot:jgi/Botrbrau1/11336/Bobra.0038s0095.1
MRYTMWQLVVYSLLLSTICLMPVVGKPPQAKVTLQCRVTGPKVWTSASLVTQPNCFITGVSAV